MTEKTRVSANKIVLVSVGTVLLVVFLFASWIVGSRVVSRAPQESRTSSRDAGSVGGAQEFSGKQERGAGAGKDFPTPEPPPQGIPDQPGAKIVKTGSVELRVKETRFDRAVEQAQTVAKSLGGYVANASVSRQPKEPSSGTMTIQVPSDKFDTAMARLRKIGTARNVQVSSRDVSREFVDLEARLKNQQAQEQVLLRLMQRADTVGDTIAVQTQLSQVQQQIEELKGQLDFLKGQTDFSAIELSINTSGPVVIQTTGLKQALTEAFRGFMIIIAGAIILLGYLLGFAVVLGIPAAIIWMLARRARRQQQD